MPLSSKAQKGIFILGSFVVLLLAVLLYTRLNHLLDSFKWVDHTNKIELKLEYALSYLKDAESGQRGFLLTSDSSFLQHYLGARERIDSVMAQVENLTKDNPVQQQNFFSLQSLIDRRFYLLDNNLAKAAVPRDSLRFDLELGKVSMDRIRDQVNRMKKIEQDQLKKRENLKDYYARLTPLSLLFLVFGMLAIIGFSYYGLTKQLQQTRKYATNLDYLNKELILKNKQLENSIEELNSFNYIASHDLKEPLRKILFFSDMIKSGTPQLAAVGRQYLEKIQTSGERMKNLLEDLLVYAQASVGERTIETVDLNTLLDTVTESLSEVLNERQGTILYEELPLIQAIPSQMQQLFENLISNSVKYSKASEAPVIKIKSSVLLQKDLPPAFEAAHDQYHCISFSDNGIGFTQDNAEKIFVLFQRLHQRHEFSGTGIGLTICKKIVQNHNGFISVKSEVNIGTTFFIYLPV